MKLNFLLTGLIFFLSISNLKCQSDFDKYKLAVEIFKPKNPVLIQLEMSKRFSFRGTKADEYIYKETTDTLKNVKLIYYNEKTNEIKPDTVTFLHSNKIPLNFQINNDLIFIIGYFNLPDSYRNAPIKKLFQLDYKDIWVQYKSNNIKLDSLPIDFLTYIGFNLSFDARYSICNFYYPNNQLVAEDKEDSIYLYDLRKIEVGIVEKHQIFCERCFNSFIINDTVYYGKEQKIGGGADGYYQNIYKAPLSNINDTILIANNIEIESITPDGKYIIGSKYLFGKYASVIVDVSVKRYQYMLGRDYYRDRMFYSNLEKKFVFDFGDRLVYLEMPENLPFDALKRPNRYKTWTDEQAESFWKKFTYEPFHKYGNYFKN